MGLRAGMNKLAKTHIMGGKKDKVTYYSEEKNGVPKTMSEEELVELVRGRTSRWADMVERT